MRDESRQHFPGRVEARRRQRGMAVVTGGKSEEIQADQTQAGRLEDSKFQALSCCTEEQPHSISRKKNHCKPPEGFS